MEEKQLMVVRMWGTPGCGAGRRGVGGMGWVHGSWGWKGIQSAEGTRQSLGEPLADPGRGTKRYCGALTGCQAQGS